MRKTNKAKTKHKMPGEAGHYLFLVTTFCRRGICEGRGGRGLVDFHELQYLRFLGGQPFLLMDINRSHVFVTLPVPEK